MFQKQLTSNYTIINVHNRKLRTKLRNTTHLTKSVPYFFLFFSSFSWFCSHIVCARLCISKKSSIFVGFFNKFNVW